MCNGIWKAGLAYLWASLLLLFVCQAVRAQEPRFSQFEAAPMMLNPALAGAVSDLALNANYRVQRLGAIHYQTTYFSSVFPLYQQEQEATRVGGLALSATHDVAGESGEVKSREVHFAGAYNVPLDLYRTQVITFGIQAGYLQTSIDFGVLNWPSQVTFNGFDPSKPVPMDQYEQSFGLFKVSAGAFWMFDPGNHPFRTGSGLKVYGGFSLVNLNKPARSWVQGNSSELPLLLRVHGGSEHALNNRLSIAPNFMVVSQQQHTQYSVGTTLRLMQHVSTPSNPKLTKLTLQMGTWYRWSDALVFLVGLSNKKFNAALSYDVNASTERAAFQSQQVLELSLGYRFLKDYRPKKISTPLF